MPSNPFSRHLTDGRRRPQMRGHTARQDPDSLLKPGTRISNAPTTTGRPGTAGSGGEAALRPTNAMDPVIDIDAYVVDGNGPVPSAEAAQPFGRYELDDEQILHRLFGI